MSSQPSRGQAKPCEGCGSAGEQVRSRVEPAARPVDVALVVAAVRVTVAGAAVFAWAVLTDAGPTVQGAGLGVALLALAVAVRRAVAVGTVLEDVEIARPAPPTRDEGEPSQAPPATGVPVGRRVVLRRAVLGGAAILGLSALAPLASLGAPRHGIAAVTAWGDGVRLVDGQDQPIRPGDVPDAGLATVWPEGQIRRELAAVILVRLPGDAAREPTRTEWVVDGLVAYSRICTHAGCPVDMFDTASGVLLCPCHQAQFDATRAAQPTFGPAHRALPQLPLGTDGEGYLVALGDFPEPVGPSTG